MVVKKEMDEGIKRKRGKILTEAFPKRRRYNPNPKDIGHQGKEKRDGICNMQNQ